MKSPRQFHVSLFTSYLSRPESDFFSILGVERGKGDEYESVAGWFLR